MDRKGLEQLIFDTYSVEPDYPWMDTPESAVFRHAANRKWFALVTTVPKSKLGLPGQQPVDIVNLKCDPAPTKKAMVLSVTSRVRGWKTHLYN